MTDSKDLSSRKASLNDERRALLLKRLQGKQKEARPAGIPRQSLDAPLPLSYTQQRIWFLQQLFPDNRAYNMAESWRLRGPLDVAALERALNEVARRHASLRTTFVVENGESWQVIASEAQLMVSTSDISHLPSATRDSELQKLILEEGNFAFDLGSGPLLRLSVIHLGPFDHVLVLTMHHIITDEWSNDIFWRDLKMAYAAALDVVKFQPEELPVQYADYAVWQRDEIQKGALDGQMAYWQDRLGGELPLLQLPSDHPRPKDQSLRGGVLRRSLPSDLLSGLQALGQEMGATLYMILLAAYEVLLYRYSGQEEILVGTPIANRQRPETKDVMGMFINTAVIRGDLSGNPSFRQLLDQVRKKVLEALENQDFPFDLLVQTMQPDRDLSYNPIFQSMFVYRAEEEARSLPGLQFERIEVDHGVSKFDLTLFAGQENGALFSALEFSADLFEPQTAALLLDHWQVLLAAIVADSDAPVDTLPLLAPGEQQQLMEMGRGNLLALPDTRCIHERIAEVAWRIPHETAVAARNATLTYGELNDRANRLASSLLVQGVQPGTPVALFVERSADMVTGILGILKAGAAYVPLEPSYPEERISFALADTGAPVLVTQSHLLDRLPAHKAAVITLEEVLLQENGGKVDSPTAAVSLEDPAYIIYTSGSTGMPKGVVVRHRNLLASTLARDAYYESAVGRYLLLSSFAFDSSVAGIFWTLVDGGMLVLPELDQEKDVYSLAGLIAREQVTHTLAMPSLYRLLLSFAPPNSLDSLRLVIVAGEACPPDLAGLHAGKLPSCDLVNEYGPTEATVWCTVYRLPRESSGALVPIGRPIPGSHIYILDRARRPVPIGVTGELYAGGQGVTAGYLNNPRLTAEKFLALDFDGFAADGYVYRTGDLARWRADGQIEFLGRVDNQVKIRGYRIEPGEIESVLQSHPAVQETAVTVWQQAENGPASEKSLIAYVVAGDRLGDPPVDGPALLAYLTGQLPGFMAPRQVIMLPALPRTPNGKLDHSQLPQPDMARESSKTFVAPRTTQENILSRIWSEVLQVQDVGIEDNFFELGGDSIMVIQVIARARQEGLYLTPRQVFQEQTVARLAAAASLEEKLSPVVEEEQGPIPLTPVQHWFFSQDLKNPAHWNQASWFEVSAEINLDQLNSALTQVMAHHPLLRARFRQRDGRWQQEVNSETEQVIITRIELAGLDAGVQDDEMLQKANQFHGTLAIDEGPLLRAVYFDLGNDRAPRLLVIIHHLVVDMVSWGILLSDLSAAFGQIFRGEAVNLPASRTSYGQWAKTLARIAGEDAMREEATYWLETLQGRETLLFDGESGRGNTEGEAGLVTRILDQEKTTLLLRDVHKAYHTRIDDLLLAALARTMTNWTQNPSLLVTLERHGREQVAPQIDVSQTVGWFTCLFPLLLTPGELTDVGGNIRAVKEQLREVPQNGIGFGILRYLAPPEQRRLFAALPEPQILFNYLGQQASPAESATPLRPITAGIGQAYGPQNARYHLLDINARVEDGRLVVRWQYAGRQFQEAEIEALAGTYIAELEALIDHCMQVEEARYTPSDFPLAEIDQEDLDSLADLLEGLD